MIETVICSDFLGCGVQKNQENGKIGNRKPSGALFSYSLVPGSASIYHYCDGILVGIESNQKCNLAKQKFGKAKMKVAHGDNS